MLRIEIEQYYTIALPCYTLHSIAHYKVYLFKDECIFGLKKKLNELTRDYSSSTRTLHVTSPTSATTKDIQQPKVSNNWQNAINALANKVSMLSAR